jgi:hypothetical protein
MDRTSGYACGETVQRLVREHGMGGAAVMVIGNV